MCVCGCVCHRATLHHGKVNSEIQQWQLDKQIIESSRNCRCQRFVSMHKGEKAVRSARSFQRCSGRPSGCPGQHDAPVKKLNAPALLSPLPPRPWIFHRFIRSEPPNPPGAHNVNVWPNQFCRHRPNLYQSRAQVEKVLVLWRSQFRLE